jgi:hypothetical protein
MIRRQIQLTEEQARLLRELARARGSSMAEVVRESIDEYLAKNRGGARERLAARARALAGRFRSGRPDLAEQHDRYLVEDLEE